MPSFQDFSVGFFVLVILLLAVFRIADMFQSIGAGKRRKQHQMRSSSAPGFEPGMSIPQGISVVEECGIVFARHDEWVKEMALKEIRNRADIEATVQFLAAKQMRFKAAAKFVSGAFGLSPDEAKETLETHASWDLDAERQREHKYMREHR